MANELSNLKPPKGSRRNRFRKGRGEGSSLGKTAGHGTQDSARDTPRHRIRGRSDAARPAAPAGFVHLATRYTEVRLDKIAALCKDGDVLDAALGGAA